MIQMTFFKIINYNSLKYFEINFLLEPKYCLNISIIGTLKINMFSVYLKKKCFDL